MVPWLVLLGVILAPSAAFLFWGFRASRRDMTLMRATETTPAVIRIALKYGPRGEDVISGIERVSRPGRRVYFGRNDVPKVMGGLGTSILTTSQGVMTGRDAVKAGVGGEVLCNIW